MTDLTKNTDMYKILAGSFKEENPDAENIVKERKYLKSIKRSTSGGGMPGRLGKAKPGDPNQPVVPSDQPSSNVAKAPQTGETEEPTAGSKPGEEQSEHPTAGDKEDITPTATPEEPPPEGTEEEPEPETREKSNRLGQTGIAATWLKDDFIIPQGAKGRNLYNIRTQVKTRTGTLTILNLGLSKGSNLLQNPTITYELILQTEQGEKRSKAVVPFKVVQGLNPENHFSSVVAHLKNNTDSLEEPTAVASGGPPALPGGAP